MESSTLSNELRSVLQKNLPTGWSCKIHDNGIPFWYHEGTTVVSWTKPYIRTTRLLVRDITYEWDISL